VGGASILWATPSPVFDRALSGGDGLFCLRRRIATDAGKDIDVSSGLGGKLVWQEHPTDKELDEFLRAGTLPANADVRQGRIVRHLLGECFECQERSRSRLSTPGESGYDAAFAGAERALSDFFSPGRAPERPAEELVNELQSYPVEEQAFLIVSDRFANPAVVELLVERSHGKRYKDAEEMAHLAHLAVLAADACTAEATGSKRRLSDLRGQSWGNLGNSLRICGRPIEADEAIAKAESLLRSGTGDPPLRARLLEQKTSLRMFQGRYPDAIELAEEAAGIYQEIGLLHDFASSLVQKAVACYDAGEPEEAVIVLNRAIPLIDPEGNPHLLLAACHNLMHSYISLGRPEQALSLYFDVRDLYEEFDDDLILLRVSWQQGQLLRDLGHLTAAETALLQARKGFVERNLAHEVAMVSLDLAWVYVKLGRIDSLKQTVAEAIPIFTALRVGREALAALLQLQHAAGQEQQALELIHMLNTRLAPLANRTAK
jgi:tetratricopeptide (TPR) repeat protein